MSSSDSTTILLWLLRWENRWEKFPYLSCRFCHWYWWYGYRLTKHQNLVMGFPARETRRYQYHERHRWSREVHVSNSWLSRTTLSRCHRSYHWATQDWRKTFQKKVSHTVFHTVLVVIRLWCRKRRSPGLSIFRELKRTHWAKREYQLVSRSFQAWTILKSLESAPDWCISRSRFGEHRCQCGKIMTEQSVSSSILVKNFSENKPLAQITKIILSVMEKVKEM